MPQASGAPMQERDPYAVLGVKLEATPAEVKKRYWRLSLLIHPDKCGHARAHDAFQAVSRAAHDLQVPHHCLELSLRDLVTGQSGGGASHAPFPSASPPVT